MDTVNLLNILVCGLLLLSIAFTILGLPGNILIFVIALTYAFYENFSIITYKTLFILLVLLASGELAEFFTGALAVKKANASKSTFKAALIGSIIGGLLGTLVIPLIGSLLGAVAGVFATSYLAEYLQTADLKKSKQVAFQAAQGQFLGTILKLLISLCMAATVIYYLKWQ